ncbi:MAG: hypothetical protein COB60_12845 [Flavobacteriaceae bacterium]|nr:MAG: hypothetical protein COB60_12845 [Flavobacteriaceae bacterium]
MLQKILQGCIPFFASCKAYGINPNTWLKNVLDRIQEYKANKLYELLPGNWKHL